MRVADLIAEILAARGVRTVFSVTGGASAWLNDALELHGGFETIYCHHEQAATIAAEGYSRASGKIGVAIVTIGPGATNALTGVAGAWMDSVPLLVISGQSFSHQTVAGTRLRQHGVQEFDVLPVVQTFTKYQASLNQANRTSEIFEIAFHLAEAERRGPVWVDIPGNVQSEEVSESEPRPVRRLDLGVLDPQPHVVEEVAAGLGEARRPLLHFGSGVARGERIGRETQFAEEHGIPFVTAHNSNDFAATSNRLRVGFPGVFGNRAANFAVQKCDFYLAVGVRLSLPQTGYAPYEYAPSAKKFVVDIDPAELFKPSLANFTLVHSDAVRFLDRLSDVMDADFRAPASWVSVCDRLKSEFPPIEFSNPKESVSNTINSYELLSELPKVAANFKIFITDMGLSYQSTHQALSLNLGQRLITNTGHAAMGWGLPAAVGAAVAERGQKVLCLTGDGGLMMNLQELATVAWHNLDVKVLIFDNRGYLTLRQTQEIGFDKRFTGVDDQTGLHFPDFSALAQSFGIPAAVLDPHRNLAAQLGDIFESPGPSVIVAPMSLEQAQGPKMVSARNPDGSIRQSLLHDMWPFLDPKLVAEVLSWE